MKSAVSAHRLFPAIPRASRAEASSRWSGLALAALFAVAALGTLVIARSVEHGAIPLPECGFKKFSGLACPGCGGTRSLVALRALEPLHALALNPAVALAWFLAVAGVPIAVIDAMCARGRGATWLARFVSTRAAARLLWAVVAANWIYLIVVGR